MNTPTLMTERLILRKFTENDAEALFKIYGDEEVNTFLPWFPLKTLEETREFYLKRYENVFGYALRKDFWRNGFITEAGVAVIEQLKRDGIPFITATHDINNPKSGEVMKRLKMTYQYSYVEQWQPKNFPVTFRMYQLNLDGNGGRVYKEYWDNSTVHFIEENI